MSSKKVNTHGTVAYSICVGFREWIYEQNLMDLGYVGSAYTWFRGLNKDTFKGERLDRALGSLNRKNVSQIL